MRPEGGCAAPVAKYKYLIVAVGTLYQNFKRFRLFSSCIFYSGVGPCVITFPIFHPAQDRTPDNQYVHLAQVKKSLVEAPVMQQKLPPWPPRASRVKNVSTLSRGGICSIGDNTIIMSQKAPTTSSPAGAHVVSPAARSRALRRQREINPTAGGSVLDVPIFGGHYESANTMDSRLDCSWGSGCRLSSIDPTPRREPDEQGGGVEHARLAAAALAPAGKISGSGNSDDNRARLLTKVPESASNATDLAEVHTAARSCREGRVGQRVRFSPKVQAGDGRSPTPCDVADTIPGHEREEGAADGLLEPPVTNRASETFTPVVVIKSKTGGNGGKGWESSSIPKPERAMGRLQRRSEAVLAAAPDAAPYCAARRSASCGASTMTRRSAPRPGMEDSKGSDCFVSSEKRSPCLVQRRSGMHTSWRRRQRAVNGAVEDDDRPSLPPPPPPSQSVAAETVSAEEDCSSSVVRRHHYDGAPTGRRNDIAHVGADELIRLTSSRQEQQQQQQKPARIFLRRERPALSPRPHHAQNCPVPGSTPSGAFISPSATATSRVDSGGGARRVTTTTLCRRPNWGGVLQPREGGGGRGGALNCHDDASNPLCGTNGRRRRQPTQQQQQQRLALARGRTATSSTDNARFDRENSPPAPAKALLLSSAAARQNLARVARASKIGTKADPVTLYRQRLESEKARRVNSAAKSRRTRARGSSSSSSSDGAGGCRSRRPAGGPAWEVQQVGRSRQGLSVSWR